MINARVGYEVNTSQLDKANNSLERMARSSTKVAMGAKNVEASLVTASARAHTYSTQVNKATLQTANLGAQFNDIGVMLAAGQSPLLLAVQQGTQINQVLAQMGGSLKDKRVAFAAAFKSMFGFTSLLTIGVIAAGAAVVQFGLNAIKSANDVKSLEDAIDDMSSVLKSFEDAVGDASLSFSGLISEFGSASPALRNALSDIASIEKLKAAQALDEMSKSVAGLVTNLSWWDERSSQSAAQDFLGLSSIGSTSREAAAEFVRLLDTMENAGDLSERLRAAVDLRQILSDNTNGFKNMTSEQEEFRLALAYIIRDSELLGGTIDDLEKSENKRLQSVIATYETYAKMRMAAHEEYLVVQETLEAHRQKAELARTELQYGKDSSEYAFVLRKHAELAAKASAEAATSNQRLRDALVEAEMAAYDLNVEAEKNAELMKASTEFAERGIEALLKQAEAAKKLEDARQADLAALEREMSVNQAILYYGADSAEVARARREAYEEAAMAAAVAAGYDQKAAEETVKAKMAAYDLARAVDEAADNAARYANNMERASGYNDGTAPGTGNAGDGYAGVTGGNWGGIFGFGGMSGYTTHFGNSSKINFDFSPIKDTIELYKSLQKASGVASRSISKDTEEIDRALSTLTSRGNLSDALVGGAADPNFWGTFTSYGINSITQMMQTAFSAGGAGMDALSAGLSEALEGVISANAMAVNRAYSSIKDTFTVVVDYGAGKDRFKFPVVEDSNIYNKFYNDAFKNMTVTELTDFGLKGKIGKNTNISTWWKTVTKKIQEETNDELDDVLNDGINQSLDNIPDLEIQSLDSIRKPKFVNNSTIDRDITRTYSEKSHRLTKIVGGIAEDARDSIRVFSEAIGGNSDKINKVLINFKKSAGVSDNAIENAKDILVDGINRYTEKMAKAVLNGRDSLKLAGESWVETLERLAKDYWGIHSTMKLLGGQTFKNNLKGADAASSLVQNFGGVDEFNSAASTYFSVAFSGDQQQKAVEKYISQVLKAAGVNPDNAPTTRQEYQDLVNRFDLNSKRGRKKYTALISLAEMFDQVLPAWDSLEEEAQNSLNGKGKNFVLDRLDNMISKAREAQGAYARLADSLASTAEDIRESALTPQRAFDVLKQEFNSLYTKGLTGDLDALEAVGGVAKDYMAAFADRASNAADLRFASAVTANKLDQLSDTAKVGEALSEYQVKTLERLRTQIEDGKIRNKLVQNVVDAIGGMDKKTFKAIAALYEAQTGKTLTATNTPTGGVRVKVKGDKQLTNLSNVTADVVSGGSGGGDGVTAIVNATDNGLDRLRTELKTLIRREIRVIKKGNRYEKRSMRTLEDIYENGLP